MGISTGNIGIMTESGKGKDRNKKCKMTGNNDGVIMTGSGKDRKSK